MFEWLIWLPITFIVAIGIVSYPFGLPRNLPTIPIYVSFLPLLTDMDQLEIFEKYIREPMEKYGAVKIFFANRWNILTSKPEFLNVMFRNEDTFAKSGNQKKIPYSVLAQYTGDNVISAHGKIWMKYRNCIKSQLTIFDQQPLLNNAQLFVKLLDNQIKRSKDNVILLPPLIQRLTLANISQIALGFDIGTLNFSAEGEICFSELHEKLNSVKRQIFNPLFLAFPWLDMLPLSSRQKARQNVGEFRTLLMNIVYRNLMGNFKFEQTNNAASGLIREWKLQGINEEQLKDNLVIILVAGHENPQLLLTTLFYILAKHNSLQFELRSAMAKLEKPENIERCWELTRFIYEAIRMYPPLGQIINRKTTKRCQLGPGIVIEKNTYVGYNNYGTGTSKQVWGENAQTFTPERWGSSDEEITKNWKKHKYDASIAAFHGGRRACLGEKIALLEMKYTLYYVLKNFEINMDPQWPDKMTPAGPICPRMLNVKLTRLKVETNSEQNSGP